MGRVKIFAAFAAVLLLCPALCISAYAASGDGGAAAVADENINSALENILGEYEDALPEGLPSLTDAESVGDALSLRALLAELLSCIKGSLPDFIRFLLTVLGASMICALASSSVWRDGGGAAPLICAVASALVFSRIYPLSLGIADAIGEIGDMFSALIPIFASLNYAGMSPCTASVESLGMSLTLNFYFVLCRELLMPLSMLSLVLSALSGIGGPGLLRILRSVRNIFFTALGAVSFLLGALFSLESLVAHSADSFALRGVKYAVQGMIPVVGSAVSGAMSALLGGVAYIRGIVGGGAVAAVLLMGMAPLVSLLLYRLAFTLSSFAVGIFSDEGERNISALASALDIQIGVYALGLLIFIFEVAVFMKGGAAL